jgi:hypothetical protein
VRCGRDFLGQVDAVSHAQPGRDRSDEERHLRRVRWSRRTALSRVIMDGSRGSLGTVDEARVRDVVRVRSAARNSSYGARVGRRSYRSGCLCAGPRLWPGPGPTRWCSDARHTPSVNSGRLVRGTGASRPGCLAGYSVPTGDSYATDLRLFRP